MTSGPRQHDNRRRAESFGADAETYDRIRPRYPEAVFDLLLEGAAPLDVLDVGTGTGIAARAMTARGARVLGLEIDDRMADVARLLGQTVETARFESWDSAGRSFDLVTCAQAWHWIDPTAGAQKAAEVLRPGGRLAPFWNYVELTDAQRHRLIPIYERWAPELAESIVLGLGVTTLGRHRDELDATGYFTTAQWHEFRWTRDYSGPEWTALIGTHSDHRLLPAGSRTRLLQEIEQAIADDGGTLPVRYCTSVITATVR